MDPLVDKAQSVLAQRKSGPCGQMYSKCDIFSDLNDFLKARSADVFLIGISVLYRGSFEKNKDVEIKCIRAGSHCLIEKPLCVIEPERFEDYSKELVKVQAEKNVIVSVGYMFK